MPRSKKKVPAYCHHKASGQGYVRLDGKDRYLGPYGSPESQDEYQRVIAEWRAREHEAAEARAKPDGTQKARTAELTVVEVLAEYWKFAQTYYVHNGKPTSELTGMRDALKPVKKLYGRTRAAEFGPLALTAVQAHLVASDLCRTEINKRINRIRRAFKWAVSQELVPPSIDHGLKTVAPLRRGRTNARESDKVKPVPDEHVEALLPFLNPVIRTMVQLQRLTGMRPGEVVQMKPGDIDRSGPVWLYSPQQHKNAWREHDRIIPLGPKSQNLLQPYLERAAEKYLFSPREAEAHRREQQQTECGQSRTTKIYPSELRARKRRKEERQKKTRKRPPRECYDRDSYGRAITYAFKRAKAAGVEIPHWHPHQLRHSRATEIRRQFGIEAAQVSLGHARADVTEIYAERNLQLAIEIAAKHG